MFRKIRLLHPPTAMLLLLYLSSVSAQDTSPAIMHLSANELNAGRQFLYRTEDGDIFVKAKVLEQLRIRPEIWVDKVNKKKQVSLRSLAPDVRFQVEEDYARLILTINADIYEPQVITAPPKPVPVRGPAQIVQPAERSGFLNYRLESPLQDPEALLYFEAGLTWNQWFVFSSFNQDERNLSYLSRDWPEKLQRLQIGDVTAQGNTLTGSLGRLGGVAWYKDFSLNRQLQYRPDVSLETVLETPAHAELYVNDRLLDSWELLPGRVIFPDLPVGASRGEAVLVLTDAFGREERIEQPFYLSGRLLPKDMRDYHFTAGFIRENSGSDYTDKPAIGGFYRYGVSGALTAGLHWAWQERSYVISPGLTGVFGSHSEWNLDSAYSDHDGHTGYAVKGLYKLMPLNLSLSAGLYSPGFTRMSGQTPETVDFNGDEPDDEEESAEDEIVAATQKHRFSLNWSYQLSKAGRLALSYGESMLHGEQGKDRNFSAQYNLPLFRVLNLTFGMRKRFSEERNDMLYFASLRYQPRKSPHSRRFFDSAGSYVRHQEGGGENRFEIRKQADSALGYSYNLRFSETDSATTDLYSAYRNPHARFTASLKHAEHGLTGKLSMAQGIAYLDNSFHVGQPVGNSFAVVELEGIDKAEIGFNSKTYATLTAPKKMLLPDLMAHQENQVYVVRDSRWFKYKTPYPNQYVNFKQRGGVAVKFEFAAFSSVEGNLYEEKPDGNRHALEFFPLKITSPDGTERESLTGYEGFFELKDLPSGEHTLSITGVCTAVVEVPYTEEKSAKIGVVVCH
ncbi:MAG: fimbrial biogenesis outer membrane usher protein [Gammaproteobacteria bacterium]|nr:fimbrial biogenesis outer membrane usher protein [Gammaproteobacteria bacterium]